jgi:hypothetical protein
MNYVSCSVADRDPGWGKTGSGPGIRDEQQGNFFDAGSGMEKFGSGIPNPQYLFYDGIDVVISKHSQLQER